MKKCKSCNRDPKGRRFSTSVSWIKGMKCFSRVIFQIAVTLKVKVLVGQSCPTLCDPMDCNPTGSSIQGILQAGILEWAAISSTGRGLIKVSVREKSLLSPVPPSTSLLVLQVGNQRQAGQGRRGGWRVFTFNQV